MAVPMLLALLLALPQVTHSASLQGVEFDPRVVASGARLELRNLALLRYRWFFKVYVAALYLENDAAPEAILDADVPRRLEIQYLYPFSREDFARSTREGIAKNAGPNVARDLAPQIKRFNALYRLVSPGDRYALTYVPRVGTELALNGQALGVISGAEFASALFAIWFGPAPLDEALKRDLLGTP